MPIKPEPEPELEPEPEGHPAGAGAAGLGLAPAAAAAAAAPAPAVPRAAPSNPRAPSGAVSAGRGGAKRHRKVLRGNVEGITKPAIRRLARRGGVARISGAVYEEARAALAEFLRGAVVGAVAYTEHARRMTVTAADVVYALKAQGRRLYGFGV